MRSSLLFDALFARSGNLAAVTLFMVLLSLIQAVYQPSVQASVPTLVAEGAPDRRQRRCAPGAGVDRAAGPRPPGHPHGLFGIYPILAVSAGCFSAPPCWSFSSHPLYAPAPHRTPPDPGQGRPGRCLRFLSPGLPCPPPAVGYRGPHQSVSLLLFTVGLPYLVKVHLGLSDQLYGLAEAAWAWAPS